MEPENHNKGNLLRWSVLLFLILIWAGMVLYGERAQAKAMLISLKLLPQPEHFTELYFTDPRAIPTSTIQGEPIAFSFSIGNQEGATMTYPYDVYFKYPDGRTIDLVNGATSVAAGATVMIPVSYSFPNIKQVISEQGEVVVSLPSESNQQIDFYLPYDN
jgi:hypothetical protein